MSAGQAIASVAAHLPSGGSEELIPVELFPPSLGTNTEAPQEETGRLLPIYQIYQRIQLRPETDLSTDVTKQLTLVEPAWTERIMASQQIASEWAGRDIVLERLRSLRLDGEVDDLGRHKPTDHAYATAQQLVSQAAIDLGPDFPAASASLDSEGGIRITWFRGNREVELVCPASSEPAPFIYQEAGSEYNLEAGAGSRALVRWLQWLGKRD